MRSSTQDTAAGNLLLTCLRADGIRALAAAIARMVITVSSTIGFFSRARPYFAAQGFNRLVWLVTDKGSNYGPRSSSIP